MTIRKASRSKARLRLGISAPSGAGKTLGSLLLAYGIMRAAYPELPEAAIWDKIGLIDTEEGSGELYVGVTKHGVTIGEFNYIRVSSPFTMRKYMDALRDMENARMEIIIIDSTTHAWAGAGGLLDKQGKITDESKSKNSYYAWRQVTPEHNAFVDGMLHSPAHIIATMRAKVEYAVDGAKVVKLGLAPVQREGMEYEFTTFFDIASNSFATASKDRTDLFSTITAANVLEKRQFMITPIIGAELYKWLDTGRENIDSLAQRLAEAVKSSVDLEATWTEWKVNIDRIELERPAWKPFIYSMFETRSAELKNTPQSV